MNLIEFNGDTEIIHSEHPSEQALKLEVTGVATIQNPDDPNATMKVPASLTIEYPGDGTTAPPRPIGTAGDVVTQPNSHYRLERKDETAPALLDDFSGLLSAHYDAAKNQDNYEGGGRDNDRAYAISSTRNGRTVSLRLFYATTAGVRGDNNVMAALRNSG
jgi:hypothetical protein